MIVPMKRLTLVALREDEENILEALQKLSAVQIISTGEARGSGRLEALRREVERIGGARRAMKPYYKKKLLAPAPLCDAEELLEGRRKSARLVERIESLEAALAAKRAEAQRHDATADSLAPFEALHIPIEQIKPTKNIRYIAGVADVKALAQVRALPAILDADIAIEEYPCAGALTGVLIGCFALDRDAILRALKETAFAEFSFPALTGTPAQVMEAERQAARALEEECEAIQGQLRALCDEREELDKAQDAAAIERDREENRLALSETDYAFVMDAWARADKLGEIEAAVRGTTDAFHLEWRDPLEDETPPTLMKNGKFVEPYESIVELYTRPAYRGIDATPTLAPFYFLFFGMMLSDTGYGLILFVGGLLLIRFIRPKKSMENLIRVIAYGGLSAAICGPFIGTLFGVDWNVIFGTTGVFPLLFDPMVDVVPMMALSCGLGLVHMFTGLIVKMHMCFRDGDWQSAIFDQLSWILLIVGILVFALLPAAKIAAFVLIGFGGGMLLLFSGRAKKNPVARIGKGLSALYGITGYLSDLLSYVRIFALGLVTGAMGMVFNLIGKLIFDAFAGLGVPGIVLGVIFAGAILVVLHVFSLFINTLGSFAHTARLQFVEFFGKFYESNGLAFKPLGEHTKNVQLRREKTV